MTLPSRRQLLGGLAATAGLAALPLPALALNNAEATALIDQVVADINGIINSGKSESAMYGDFERVFTRYGDVPTIARYTLGPDARRASPAQMQAYTRAFAGYLSRKYGKRFREFIGGKVDVKGARQVGGGNFEVQTLANLRGWSPFAVSFMVSDKSGKDLFYDMLIEGISLLKSERTEIGAMVDQNGGDLNRMIAALQKAG